LLLARCVLLYRLFARTRSGADIPVLALATVLIIAMPKLIESINEKIQDGEVFFSLEFFPPRTPSGARNLVSRFDRFAKGDPLFIDITWGAGGGTPEDDSIDTSSMSIASTALNYCGLPTMLHLTCAGLSRKRVIDVLQRAKKLGIRNILALRGGACSSYCCSCCGGGGGGNGASNSATRAALVRHCGDEGAGGRVRARMRERERESLMNDVIDAPPGKDWKHNDHGLNYGKDLVALIRAEFGDYFGICVAGYASHLMPRGPSRASAS